MKKLKPEAVYWILTTGWSLFLSVIFTASMVYYVNRVGLNPLQLVLVGTTLEVSVLLFEVPTGVLADVYSRRLSILIGTAVMGFGFIVEGLIPTFAAVLASQVIWGIGFTFTSGATEAWIVDEVGESHAARLFLRSTQMTQIGDLIGIGLGALLGSLLINIPIVVGGVGLIGLAAFMVFVMPEHNFKPKVNEAGRFDLASGLKASRDTLRDALKVVRVHPWLLTIFGIGLFYGLYSEGYDRLSVAHLLDDTTIPAIAGLAPVVWIGAIGIVESVLALVLTELVRRRLEHANVQRLTQALFGLSAALVGALVGFALAGNFWVAAALMVTVGIFRQLIDPLYNTWINQRLDSSVRATVISMSGQVNAVGQIVGGPGVGWIGNAVSIPAALLTSAGILAPVLALYAAAFRRGKDDTPNEQGETYAAGVYQGAKAE